MTMTPESPIWDAYDQTYTDNERSMTNFHEHLRPPIFVHTAFVAVGDIANINLIMAFDTVNCCDKDAVLAAFEA